MIKLLDFIYFYVFRPLCFAIFSFYKVEINGRENIPRGAFIIAANHRSYIDPPFIAWILRPRVVNWIVAKHIYYKWYFHFACMISRSVPINGSARPAEAILNKGGIVGIFPQGGICRTRRIEKGHSGVAVLALNTGLPVLPCCIDGTFDTSKPIIKVPKVFTHLKLTIGKPLYFEKKSYYNRIPKAVLDKTLPKIINAINSLKPV